MKHFSFENGDKIDVLGLGTWKMADGVAFDAVKSAIKIGYRHIDCAWIYLNESDVGRAIEECVQDKIIKRDELWLTSKLWNDRHRPEHVAAALKEQLLALRLDYLDQYMIHWPVVQQYKTLRPEAATDYASLDDVPLAETWQAMLECVAEGLCRHIGVANFSAKKIEALIESTGTAPASNQVESHVLLQQDKLFDYCRSNGIAFVAYSPLGSGDRDHAMKKNDEPNMFNIPTIQDVAQQHAATPAQILLAWSINRGAIPIPKSSNPVRQKENLAAAKIELTIDEMQQLASLDRHYRYVDGSFWEVPGGPYTMANLWDE